MIRNFADVNPTKAVCSDWLFFELGSRPFTHIVLQGIAAVVCVMLTTLTAGYTLGTAVL